MKPRLDILNLEWPRSDRDLGASLFVLEKLKRKGITYKTKSIFTGKYYLLKYRPKLLYVSNFSGGKINVEICKFASRLGIKVISNVSEGNFLEENLDEFLWGNCKEKDWFPDKLFLWSDHYKEMVVRKYPELASKIFVSGNVSIDKHLLTNFIGKETFLSNLGKGQDYDSVVVLAAWSFDIVYKFSNNEGIEKLSDEQKRKVKIHLEDLVKLQNIYREVVEANKRTLFVLKYHPATACLDNHEFSEIRNCSNTISSLDYDYMLTDYINICDLWIAYDSTTILEAWALGKPTLLINPTTVNFERNEIYKGSDIARSMKEAHSFLKQHIEGVYSICPKLREKREEFIFRTVRSISGDNFVIIEKELLASLESVSVTRVRFYHVLQAYLELIKVFLLSSAVVSMMTKKYKYYSFQNIEAKKNYIISNFKI